MSRRGVKSLLMRYTPGVIEAAGSTPKVPAWLRPPVGGQLSFSVPGMRPWRGSSTPLTPSVRPVAGFTGMPRITPA